MLKVVVIGMGYIGLPMAALLADAGCDVVGVDINEEKLDLISKGKTPFDEPGLDELVARCVKVGKLTVQKEVPEADFFIIAVPTPVRGRACDLKYVVSAMKGVVEKAKDGDLVVLESTVRPGTCVSVLKPMFEKAGKDVLIAHCPERAIPGMTLKELVKNDRIIGGVTYLATLRAKILYTMFVEGELLETDSVTAEAVKLFENTYRDVNIALANELEEISGELGIDFWETIGMANRHPRVNIHKAGVGVGGHCIAIDPWFLIEKSVSGRLIRTAREINDGRPHLIARRAMERLEESGGLKVAILGVTYKENIDDCRESPSEKLYEELEAMGYEVQAHDPLVRKWKYPLCDDLEKIQNWADLVIVAVPHDFYKDKITCKRVLDTRNFCGK